MDNLIVGVDASNIRAGGGLTHLKNLLDYFETENSNIKKIIVWGNQETLLKLPEKEHIIKKSHPLIKKSIISRTFWQKFILPKLLEKNSVNALLSPGGITPKRKKNIPYIAISQNLLPFEKSEYTRYPILSYTRLRLFILRKAQLKSFKNSDGIIFLSEYAKNVIQKKLGNSEENYNIVIRHGIEKRFLKKPRVTTDIVNYSNQNPFKILYVSIINYYKHQIKVAEACRKLREKGYPIEIEFIGPSYKPALLDFEKYISNLDDSTFIKYSGKIPFEELHNKYYNADAFIFASSCENLPNILIEAMASGLPIASSNKGPMPEVLGDAGVYFDPENVEEIAIAIETLLTNKELRTKLANLAYKKAQEYSWENCAFETFKFVENIFLKKEKVH